MNEYSFPNIGFGNLSFLEKLHHQYLENPYAVEPSWRQCFTGAPLAVGEEGVSSDTRLSVGVGYLIQAYRTYGHLMAAVNPLQSNSLPEPEQLKISSYGLTPNDLDKVVSTRGILEKKEAPLGELIEALKSIYCGTIGFEYMGIQRPELEAWILQHVESSRFRTPFTAEQKLLLLKHLNKSGLLESFIHMKYPGQKRFSLEGAETLIPVLEGIIENGAVAGIEEVVIGMAHRGRLNVLSNILRKSYRDLFAEFEDHDTEEAVQGGGDVKYHKGYFSEILTFHGHKVKIVVPSNPSHLESIDPVVEGEVKAKQVLRNDDKHQHVLPILIHGDAAVAAQGVVYETLQLNDLEGYSTGGTIHLVINNQIGFTTTPKEGRSTLYCTDIAHAFGFPVFHVNAEDPEGCLYVSQLAFEIRRLFHVDVFIDLVCYRKYGHNESDEPAFTQPLQYQIIRNKAPIREVYLEALIKQGVVEKELAESLELEFKASLQEALKKIKEEKVESVPSQEEGSMDFKENPVNTGVDKATLREIAGRLCAIPENFKIHPKLENLLKERLAMVAEGSSAKPIDWGMAELLAYGSLLWEGSAIRLAGQDSCRGTFTHRHGVWIDQQTQAPYFSLHHLKEGQGRFDLINSPLSEYAALGFEFGYSVANRDALVLWEAQFGDFANGAQIIFDQYLSTAEQKWGEEVGLVCLLPHGYEGQGPEHSSGRIERFLALAGNDNLRIVNPTTPAQFFHVLRRQMKLPMRKPLIVFTPKGLLRYPACVSTLDELSQGSFQKIIADKQFASAAAAVIFCSGRVYYDLILQREKLKRNDVAIHRIEQLYPLSLESVKSLLEASASAKRVLWVQEEPKNMGAWSYMEPLLLKVLEGRLPLMYVGRARSASPATGSHAAHERENHDIMNAIFQT